MKIVNSFGFCGYNYLISTNGKEYFVGKQKKDGTESVTFIARGFKNEQEAMNYINDLYNKCVPDDEKHLKENKNKIKLTESKLRSIIANVINEEKLKRERNLFESVLNEGMVFPMEVNKIWWDGNDSFVVLGGDNRWYNVYPNYGDAYIADCESDKLFESYVEKIKQAYANNGIRPHVFTYNLDGTAQIIDETGNAKFFEQLNSWLEKKGFVLKEKPSENNWYRAVWEYTGEYGDDSQNSEKLEMVSKMQDVTDKVGHFFDGYGSPKSQTRQALDYLQNSSNNY